MKARTLVAVATSLACALAAHARDLRPGEVEIDLHARVEPQNRQVLLGDVAFVRTTELGIAQRLVTLPLGDAPLAGGEAVLDRDALAAWIRTRLGVSPTQLVWAGAQRAVVRGAVQKLASVRVEEKARAALLEWLAPITSRAAVESTGMREDLALPPGRIELAARPFAAGTQPVPRMTVWIDVSVDGAFVRTIPVTFMVDAWREGWVATEALGAGAAIGGPLVQQREVRSPAGGAAPVSAASTALRTVRPLKAGEVLTTANTKPATAVARGDWVSLRFAAGALHLESRAEALQDGDVGQIVRVRLAGAPGPVEARIVSQGRVEAMP
ncbi:MAG TPA: flagellar basal body P-ring formation chaperone FlgA [Ramlibacter sp.]|uniref:flagellar basal body P-ring formation chaperone FlgA n=1 Tax=Ramlibacter sp. TaxID=1917967 RepID=UPI002B69396D|nr:flagellar basal body P-ring formation chaperone FlgA [Ramlibacter sp.]HVZ46129.1 flagellar basal body P-ring formation chaperone FlgA [Ramlibacter sp.]